jgi:hypothetical protein
LVKAEPSHFKKEHQVLRKQECHPLDVAPLAAPAEASLYKRVPASKFETSAVVGTWFLRNKVWLAIDHFLKKVKRF